MAEVRRKERPYGRTRRRSEGNVARLVAILRERSSLTRPPLVHISSPPEGAVRAIGPMVGVVASSRPVRTGAKGFVS